MEPSGVITHTGCSADGLNTGSCLQNIPNRLGSCTLGYEIDVPRRTTAAKASYVYLLLTGVWVIINCELHTIITAKIYAASIIIHYTSRILKQAGLLTYQPHQWLATVSSGYLHERGAFACLVPLQHTSHGITQLANTPQHLPQFRSDNQVDSEPFA
jgi:hypothetical protein